MSVSNALWIPVYSDFHENPKLRKFAKAHDLELPCAMGYLVTLWLWAQRRQTHGDLDKYDADDIADAAMWKGNSTEFVDSLVDFGFLDRDGDSLTIHDWSYYGGQIDADKESIDDNRALYGNKQLTDGIRGRDGNTCRYCGKEVNWNDKRSPDGGTYDKIDPKHGRSVENFVVACRSCAKAKQRRTPDDAGMTLLPPFQRRLASNSKGLASNLQQYIHTNNNKDINRDNDNDTSTLPSQFERLKSNEALQRFMKHCVDKVPYFTEKDFVDALREANQREGDLLGNDDEVIAILEGRMQETKQAADGIYRRKDITNGNGVVGHPRKYMRSAMIKIMSGMDDANSFQPH